jgi:hypothetical protein
MELVVETEGGEEVSGKKVCKAAVCAVRGKRGAIRTAAKCGRAALRKKVRCAVKGTCVCLALACLLGALGCNTATPASKSASSEANRNVPTVNNNFGFVALPASNGVPFAAGYVALSGGGVTVNVSDLNGTIAQSADTEGGDQTDLTANPSMAAGITGDAPVKAITDAVAAFASPMGAADSVMNALIRKFGLGAATNAVATAVSSACTDGSCSAK